MCCLALASRGLGSWLRWHCPRGSPVEGEHESAGAGGTIWKAQALRGSCVDAVNP